MTGQEGEEIAVAFLEKRGYRLVARNVRTTRGEIDAIAYDGEVLVFVEVKARSRRAKEQPFSAAASAVDHRKQMRLTRAAMEYLARTETTATCRFDVVVVDRHAGGVACELFQNAFEPSEMLDG